MSIDQLAEQIDVSADRATVWVHSLDGTTVGRFSKKYGMDVHRTLTEQMAGASQCLHCTHSQPVRADWLKFCELMQQHYSIEVDPTLIEI